MTIIVPKRMIFGRGVFPGAPITTFGQILVPDVTYLAQPGLTLLPDGRIQVTGPAGAGEWNIGMSVSIESSAGTARTNVIVLLTFNGVEIPSTRRFIYCRQSGFGSTAAMFARLTNLSVGDLIALQAFRSATADTVRVNTYGISGFMEKVER